MIMIKMMMMIMKMLVEVMMMMKIILDDGIKVFRDVAAKAITMIELGQNSVKSDKIWKLDRCSHLHPWSNINNENAQIENGDPHENDKKKENGDLTLGRSKGRWWLKVLGSTRSCQGPEISSLVMIIIIIIIVIFIMIIIKIIRSLVMIIIIIIIVLIFCHNFHHDYYQDHKQPGDDYHYFDCHFSHDHYRDFHCHDLIIIMIMVKMRMTVDTIIIIMLITSMMITRDWFE